MAQVKQHKGIRQFSGDEASNLFLGQGKMQVLTAGTYYTQYYEDHGGSTGGLTKIDCDFVFCIKAVDGNAEIEAQSIYGGDFTVDGAAFDGSSMVTVQDADSIYGNFQKIKIDTGDKAIVYLAG